MKYQAITKYQILFNSSWWFQPLCKIWKYAPSNWIISPIVGVNIKNMLSCHHLPVVKKMPSNPILQPSNPLQTPSKPHSFCCSKAHRDANPSKATPSNPARRTWGGSAQGQPMKPWRINGRIPYMINGSLLSTSKTMMSEYLSTEKTMQIKRNTALTVPLLTHTAPAGT